MIEIGPYIDFHETDLYTTDYDGRLLCESGVLYWNGSKVHTNANFTNLILDKFDIDGAGNVVVKTNFYSLGEGNRLQVRRVYQDLN